MKWKGREIEVKALSSKVLVVAVQGGDPRERTAYIDAVPGYSHDEEFEEVILHGSKLSMLHAQFLFPLWAKLHWRY